MTTLTEDDLLEALHAEYIKGQPQPGEITITQWADEKWGGDRKLARTELEHYARPGGEMTRRQGRDENNRPCSLYRLKAAQQVDSVDKLTD
jgi:hypothetical protein